MAGTPPRATGTSRGTSAARRRGAPDDASTRAVAAAAATTPWRRVPASEAGRQLRTSIRLVADLPKGSDGTFVWQQGDSELLVRAYDVQLACAPGRVTIGIPVSCDQLGGKPAVIAVPLAVGSPAQPAGLVMATFDRLAGPELVTALWSEAITAFAWEALVQLASEIAAAAGKDPQGRPLVPGSVAADDGALLVFPMARHDLA